MQLELQLAIPSVTNNFTILLNPLGNSKANGLKLELNCLRDFTCLLEQLGPQCYLHGV